MKPFNLEEALQGKPVQLRNGVKAYVTSAIPSEYYSPTPLSGYYLERGYHSESGLAAKRCSWKSNGRTNQHKQRDGDIIGMWEEPTPTVTVTLPKPFRPKVGEHYFYIAHLISGYINDETFEDMESEINVVNRGLCFRKKEDAQAWLDAMKEAVE